ncbi:MAG: RND transporter [Gammaproteobacteria bacterium]|jgi:predicted RND superfamily exporter protein|nr:MMPL family transporter [SAR86 cluster bacterium]GIS75272.1 MAG: RND transporter [Gammaproteobacteria bacterium]
MKKLLNVNYLAETIIRYRPLCIIISLLILAGLAQGLSKINFNPDINAFFPENDTLTTSHLSIEDTYSSMDNAVIGIGVKEGTVFTNEVLSLIEDLTERAWKTPHSLRVDSLSNYSYVSADGDDLYIEPFLEGSSTYDLKTLKEKELIIEEEELAYGAIISKDKKTSLINIVFDPPRKDIEAEYQESLNYVLGFLEEARKNHPEVDLIISGIVYMEYQSPMLLKAQMPKLMPTAILVILLTLFLLLRSLVAVAGSFLVILMSVVSAMGSIGFMSGDIAQPFIMVPILIATLAVADCVHLFTLYFQNLDSSRKSKEAMLESLKLNLQPLFLTSLTTAIGFLSLNLAPVEPLRGIGNGVAVGVFLAFIFTVLLLAPIVSYFNVKQSKNINFQKNIARKLGRFSIKNYKRLLVIVPVISCFLMAFIPLNKTNDNPLEFYSERYTTSAADSKWISQRIGGTFPVSYELNSQGIVSDPEFLREVDKFSEWLASNKEVLHVSSLSKIMKNLNKTLHGKQEEWNIIPTEPDLSAQYLFFYEMSLPYGLDLTNSISQNKESIKLVASLKELGSLEYREFAKRVENYASQNMPEDMVSIGTGTRPIFAFMSNMLITQLTYALGIGIVLITATIILFFRSLRYGMLTSVTNLLPIGVAFGIWAIVSGEISMLVGIGMGTTLGIIVDFTVHFLSKYLHARRQKNLSAEEAVEYAFETVGFALIITSFSLILGFLVLLQAFFIPIHGFVLFSSIAFLSALIIDLLLFPALLITWDKRYNY